MWVWSENSIKKGVEARSLVRSTSGVEERARAPNGARKNDKQLIHSLEFTQTKQHVGYNIIWALLVLGPHKTHHGPNLGEATTFPFIVSSAILHGGHIQMAFCPRTPKWESENSHI
jgi:hypothetical protein